MKTRVIDLDLKAYFDTVKHHLLLKKVAERINDNKVMRLLNQILKAGGKEGVPQGGVISPLLSNIYLNEVDKMLEKAKEITKEKGYTQVEYARFADDLVVLVSYHRKSDWIWKGINKRLWEELDKLQVQINEMKTRRVDLMKGESFGFMGFDMRQVVTRTGKLRAQTQPRIKSRTNLLSKLREVFERYKSQPLTAVRDIINPILRGWVQYFKIGHSTRAFDYVRNWVGKKVRRHIMRSKGMRGFGWHQWREKELFAVYKIYNDYKLAPYTVVPVQKANKL